MPVPFCCTCTTWFVVLSTKFVAGLVTIGVTPLFVVVPVAITEVAPFGVCCCSCCCTAVCRLSVVTNSLALCPANLSASAAFIA